MINYPEEKHTIVEKGFRIIALPDFYSNDYWKRSIRSIQFWLLCIILISTLFPGLVHAQTGHIVWASTYTDFDFKSGTGYPINQRQTFSDDYEKVVCWVELQNVQSGDRVRFDWYSPGGVYFFTSTTELKFKESGNAFCYYPFEAFKSHPGKWTVIIKHNGVKESEVLFTIQNPNIPTEEGSPTLIDVANQAFDSQLYDRHIISLNTFADSHLDNDYNYPIWPLSTFSSENSHVVSWAELDYVSRVISFVGNCSPLMESNFIEVHMS